MVLNRFSVDLRDPETVDKIAKGLYESEKRIAIEQGRGKDIERLEASEDVIRRYRPLIQEKAEIQKKTLSSWLDYLQENDAKQSMAFRYYVVRSLEKMGVLDKEKTTYSKRTPTTVAPFPELNSEALGWVYKRLNEGMDPAYAEDLAQAKDPEERQKLEEKIQKIEALIKSKDFAKLYAFAQIETAGRLNRESIKGAWKKYDQGSDYRLLERDLRGKGTGWCTAEGSAEAQLQGGDFYVYYSKGDGSTYTEPRVAIRMEGDSVGEVRGVNPKQELEPELVDIAQKKYHDLPGGGSYDKRAVDMKRLTKLVKLQEQGKPFSKDDLRFLYEMDAPIEGFGYDRDPRIDELKSTRNKRADLCIIFNCTEEELEEKEYVTLKDIPTFSKLPSERDLKKDYKFEWVWKEEYREGRDMEEFGLNGADFEAIKLTDKKQRKEILDAVAEAKEQAESEHVAKVFDSGDIIAKKKREDQNHPDSLTSKEVFEAIDEAGYRPATLEELLAYGKQCWKPDADPKSLTDEEKLLQRVNAPYIYALGSPFASSGGNRHVPYLGWNGGKRKLGGDWLGNDWSSGNRFLVLRK